jgi:hypothetical protein
VINIQKLYFDGDLREEDFVREKHTSIERHGDHHSWVTTDIPSTEPPAISMKLDMPILEKQIAEKGMHPDEKSKNKTPKRKSKKVHSKSNRSAMEKVQD